MQLPEVALGATLAALISAIAVYITTVLSKEQKTSEFRQVWIDALRNDISEYLSKIQSIHSLGRAHAGATEQEKLKLLVDTMDHIQEAQICEYRIALRLNPVEHTILMAKITSFQDEMLKLSSANLSGKKLISEQDKLTQSLIKESQAVLKKEWKRVKAGELSFRILKYLAATIAIIVAAYFSYDHYSQWPAEKEAVVFTH